MTTETLWIVVAVLAAVLLIALVLGLVLGRRRRISLRRPEERGGEARPQETPPRRGGSYRVESGFSFSTGTATPARPEPAEPTAGTTGEPAAPPSGSRRGGTAPVEEPVEPAAPSGVGAPEVPAPDRSAAERAVPGTGAPGTVTPEGPAAGTAAPATAAPETAAPETPAPGTVTPEGLTAGTPAPDVVAPDTPAPAVPEASAPETAAPETAAPETAAPETPAPGTVTPEGLTAGTPAPDVVAPDTPAPVVPAAPGPSTNGAVRPATAEPGAPAAPPAPAAPAELAEPIEPPAGRLVRLRGRLARSRSGFGQGLLGLLGAGELDEESWEDVEAMLLQADLGPETTAELVETLRTELAARAVRTPEQARQLLREVLTGALRTDLDRSVRALPHDERPAVLLVVGVNGTGKTTTTGKLARVLVADGRHVVLGAADTFRAAAAEQLVTWGARAGATVVRGAEGADPASVAFDAVTQATDERADAVLLDTAGRLHTKTGLMDELGKVKRVVERRAEVDEVLLVLDATTGQNGLMQARVFGDVVDVTGIVLTKLDGTAKGGIVFRVQRELGVPVKLVGLGEGPDDLAPFVPEAFVDALLT